jgi:hypothetical protein
LLGDHALNEATLFSDSNRNLIELVFAIKLSTATVSIKENEVRHLFKSLKKSHPKSFKKCELISNQELGHNLIISPTKERVLAISPINIEFKENKNFNKENFNSICDKLYEFYTSKKEVEPEDIKIMGKIYVFNYQLPTHVIEFYKDSLGIFKDQSIKQFELRNTLIEDEFNIHIYLLGVDVDEDGNINDNLTVKLDINNFNQEDGVEDNSIHNILNFCDTFAKERLNDLLNTNFC